MGDESSSSDSSDDERKNESFEEKMKRITQLGKEGNMEELVKEADLKDCSDELIAFAAQKSKDMGNQSFAKGEYTQALEHYAGALVGDIPEKWKIYSNRSACLFQLGKYTDALMEATNSIKLNRGWSKGYYRAGRAALEMEFYDEALEMFEKGLEKEPNNKDLQTWTEKARTVRNQHHQNKLVKKHATDYSKFDELTKQQQDEEDEEAMENDPNAIVFGDRYYSSSKWEQKQLKAMLGYKEAPPAPFEPTFDSDLIYRHDARGAKTNHPIWDPSRREWRIDAKPPPSRVDYSDSKETQAIALYLERQTEVNHVDDMLKLLDARAYPLEAYNNAVCDLISSAGDSMADSRWLFIGVGCGMHILTAGKKLPSTASVIVNDSRRAVHIADISMAILLSNGFPKEQLKFIHRPSSDLAVVDPDGEDINNLTQRVDVMVLDHDLFDPGLLGKGVLSKINHAKRKLVNTGHSTMPMGATVMFAPVEMISPRGESPDGLDWSSLDDCRWGAFYETVNLDDDGIHEPWRSLGPVHEVFDFDFTESEVKMSGSCDITFTASEDGILNCITFWYKLALTENVVIDHTPSELRAPNAHPPGGDYPRQAMQWLAAPVNVSKGEEITIRASFSRARIRFEVTSPEVTKRDRTVTCPRWCQIRWWDEERYMAYKKAVEKALEKIMADREEIEKLDRPPLRIICMGASIGQIPMVVAKCCREAGISDDDIETYGSTVIALENMPKMEKLARRAFRDNDLQEDIFWTKEDVRKLPNQPTRAQLLVSELIDPGLLGEGMLVLHNAARVKMLNAFDHQVIPSKGTIWAAAFEFGEHLKDYLGFDMTVFNYYRGGTMVSLDEEVEKGNCRQLTNVFEALKFDFENLDMPHFHSVKLKPTDSGKITAIVFWYEVGMDREGEVILTNWPECVPPADFAMLEKDLHRPKPLTQAITYFQGNYQKEVTAGEEIELDIGYTQAWPQFTWPGTEMVQKEDGSRIPKPPPMPRHQQYYEKMKHESADMENKLTHGLMFDEEMLGDGYAAAERVALEPNGNPNFLIDPNQANFFHMMFFL